MNKLYINADKEIKTRKYIVIEHNGLKTYNPSEELVLSNGWSVYKPPIPEPMEIPVEEQYKQRIVELIRERYSVDDELAILRQRDSKVEEFNTYNLFVEECKQKAREELGL